MEYMDFLELGGTFCVRCAQRTMKQYMPLFGYSTTGSERERDYVVDAAALLEGQDTSLWTGKRSSPIW